MTQHSTTVTDCISMVCSFTTTTTATQAMMSDLQEKNYYKLVILNETDLHSQSIIKDLCLSHTQFYSEYITSSEM